MEGSTILRKRRSREGSESLLRGSLYDTALWEESKEEAEQLVGKDNNIGRANHQKFNVEKANVGRVKRGG